MANAKYLWSLMKSSWSNAVDISVALFVSVSVINYLILGYVPPAAGSLSSLMPIITALLFASTWLFLVFFISLRETKDWTRHKRWLWAALYLVGLFLSCYLIAITEIRPGLPLSNWMYKEELGWAVLMLLFMLAIVIVITGKGIKKPPVQ